MWGSRGGTWLPRQAIGMFDMTPVGAPLMVLGILYMAFATRWLMPSTQASSLNARTEKMYARRW